MTLALLFSSIAIAPGPMDACKANIAAVKVSADFEYSVHFASSPPPIDAEHGLPAGWHPSSAPEVTVSGTWESDGKTIHVLVLPQGVKVAQGSRLRRQAIEYLMDDQIFIHHDFNNHKTILDVRKESPPHLGVYGPFDWWGVPFPTIIDQEFSGPDVQRKRSALAGRPVDLEERRQSYNSGVRHVGMAFDPSIGYLPRFIRGVSSADAALVSSVKETYINASVVCRSGGFLPTNWVEASYETKKIDPRSLTFDYLTPRSPTNRVVIGYFKILRVKELPAEARLSELNDIKVIAAPGGTTRFPRDKSTLSVNEVMRLLGSKLDRTSGALPPIKIVNTDARKSGIVERIFWLLIAIATLLGSVFAFKRSRVLPLVLMTLYCSVSGCSNAPSRVPTIELKPVDKIIMYNHGSNWVPIMLDVTNQWNRKITISSADGGCTCRKVDASAFPLSIPAGATARLAIELAPKVRYEPYYMAITMLTDVGTVVAKCKLFVIPNHYLSPDSVVMRVRHENEADEDSIEVMHRQVSPKGKSFETVELSVPIDEGFSVATIDSQTAPVDGSGEYVAKDTRYRVKLRSQKLGLFKSEFALLNDRADRLMTVPVVWQRLPYISVVPERVLIGKQAIRVFMRCEDDTIEFTQIESVPNGIKAVVSSTREVLVSVARDVPGVLDGEIKVATNSGKFPTVSFPVAHYDPSTEGQGSR